MEQGRRAPTGLAALGGTWEHDDQDHDQDCERQEAAPVASAVLAADDLPAELFVPAFPFDGGGFVRMQIQLTRCEERLLATGFTSSESLTERLGEHQPWLRMTTDALLAVVGAHDLGGLLIDPISAPTGQLWTRDALAALEEINDGRL